MKNNLEALRQDLIRAKAYLQYCESYRFSNDTKFTFELFLQRSEMALADEIERVRWAIWPGTGRPSV